MKKILIGVLLIIAAIIVLGFLFGEDDATPFVVNEEGRVGSLSQTAEILFTSNRDTGSRRTEIYSMDSEGGNITRLTFSEDHHFTFGIDNSRRYIAASRSEKDTDSPKGLGDEDRKSLWVIDLETKQEMRLTKLSNSAEVRPQGFSPDSEWIVFCMKIKGEDQTDIYKIKRDGSSLTRLTDTLTSIECDPSWSHDGAKIAYASLDGLAQNPRFVIKTMDSNGNNERTVYDGGLGVSSSAWPPGNYDPSWSSDDKWLVFERFVQYNEEKPENWGSGKWHILKVKIDGNDIINLSQIGEHTDRAEYLPSFSPDGESIVFGALFEAENPEQSFVDVFLMDANEGNLKQLTDNPASDMFPAWIPF